MDRLIKAFNSFARKESHKMRDVAIEPGIVVLFYVPWILIAIVAVVAIFAIVKVIKISRARKAAEFGAADGLEEKDDEI